jgi:myosin heavy subunit
MTTTSNSNNNSKQRLIAIAAVVVVALLAVNAVLLFNKFKLDKTVAQQGVELEEANQLQQELNEKYDQAIADLDNSREENDELDALIDQQTAELTAQKAQIEALLGDQRNLSRAREEIRKLNAQVEQYLAEIQTLKEENELLAQENTELAENNEMLSTDLETTRMANDELTTARAELVSEKAELENQNEDLSRRVNFASVVRVEGIDVTGLKTKDNGKAVKKKYAKNIDQLQVCFLTTVNEVTDPGTEQFYVRIINPVGETLAIEEMGSGIMTNSATNEQIRYTKVKEHDYSQDETQLCFIWEPNTIFQAGTYEVEIYNKGFLAGTSSFTLK